MDEKDTMILPGSEGSSLSDNTEVEVPTDYTADILSSTIKTVFLSETDEVTYPMFIVDFREAVGQLPIVYTAMKSWVLKDEVVEQMKESELATLYIITKEGKLLMLGRIKDAMARQALPYHISNMCSSDTKLYMQESQDTDMIVYKKSTVDAVKLYFAED